MEGPWPPDSIIGPEGVSAVGSDGCEAAVEADGAEEGPETAAGACGGGWVWVGGGGWFATGGWEGAAPGAVTCTLVISTTPKI